MQVVKIVIWCAVICMLIPVEIAAQSSKIKAFGEIEYKGFRGPKKDEERAALNEARQNVVDAYGATLSSERSDLYQKIKAQLYPLLDELITSYTILDEKTDKTSKRYTVYIEASLNTNIIDGEIAKVAPAVIKSGEPIMVAYFFAARQNNQIISEDDTIERESKNAERSKAAEVENAIIADDGSSVKSNYESTSVAESKSRQSGRVIKTDDIEKYVLFPAKDLRVKFNEVLDRANYEGVDPAELELDVEAIQKDFITGDISSSNRKLIYAAVREFEVPMVAFVVMNVGKAQKDSATLLSSVAVSVTAEIRDCSKRLTRTVASVAGDTYKGLGDSPQRARDQALRIAAEKTASKLVDKLRSKGIK